MATDRYFSSDPAQPRIALELYQAVAGLPLVCPHSHVDARLFVDPGYHFANPAELLIIPDHYVFRMLHSQGVRLEDLGVPRLDGAPVEADPRLTLILFTLDETAYSRELAPLASFYRAVRLGPPWWFFDSWNGMRRYFEQVMETAGLYNTAGFNDDTRAFPSIPARHDLWRRASADWLAGLVVRRMVDEDAARAMARAMAYNLAKQAYHLDVSD